jgi:RNA polymerase sigma-70 factor, ECF subfamily
LDEAALVRDAANGDTAAWESLVVIHQEAVFRLAYLLLGDPEDAKDVAQEAFLRAWKHLHSFDAERPLRPWLLRISANLARNHRRSAGRYFAALLRAFQEQPIPERIEEQNAHSLQAHELWKAVQRLNELDQQIVYLRYFLDLPVAETAEVLNVPEGTVKSRLSRALEKLRNIIRQDFPLLSEEGET